MTEFDNDQEKVTFAGTAKTLQGTDISSPNAALKIVGRDVEQTGASENHN